MPLHPAAFVLSCQATLKGAQESSHICARRSFLYSALAAALLPRSALAAESASASGGPRVWADDELCKVCKGCGRVPCTLCGGEGVYVTDDGHVVERRETCPGCRGEKTVGCLKCISTGLRDTKGFLRDASADGRIRMRRNGTFAVLQCDALPSCSIHGLNKPEESDG